jgi:hypothetical protein
MTTVWSENGDMVHQRTPFRGSDQEPKRSPKVSQWTPFVPKIVGAPESHIFGCGYQRRIGYTTLLGAPSRWTTYGSRRFEKIVDFKRFFGVGSQSAPGHQFDQPILVMGFSLTPGGSICGNS